MFEQELWQPTASIKNLLARAKIIAEIRRFFTERGLLEVETPVLSELGVTDVHLSTFSTELRRSANNQKPYGSLPAPNII